jgi:hypothetical protein
MPWRSGSENTAYLGLVEITSSPAGLMNFINERLTHVSSAQSGLLLAPHLDAAFDCGFITVDAGGGIVVSSQLADADRRLLGLDVPLYIQGLEQGHQPFLRFHREQVFRDAPAL